MFHSYYWVPRSKTIVTNGTIYDLNLIFGHKAVNHIFSQKYLIPMTKDPTVLDCLLHGSRVMAIQRYRDIHNSTLRDAMDMVTKIQADYDALRKEKKNYD